ncbi:MAG: D-galactonate dehydratase family protein [Planctomycetaceae bacterium]
MKIRDVRTVVTCPGRNYVLLKIVTDSGIHGVGDGTLNGRELAVAELLEQHLKPLLIGRDADRIEDIWQDLFRGTYWRGGPVLNTALAAIDMALWDIKGKRAQLPLYSLLGGKTRNAVLCYGHASGDSIPDTAQHAQQLIDVGYRVVRCQTQIPGTQGTYGAGRGDAPRGERLPFVETWEPTPYLNTIPKLFEFLRRELGDQIELLHDVHERLNPIQAARLACELEPFHLFFLEDPLRPEHKESFRVIRNHSTIPLAMGELFTNKWECLPLITEQLIDFIRCDLAHVGGITEARKIATLCEAFHIQTAWHGPPDVSPITHAANVHLDLALPNFGVQEWSHHPEQVADVITGGPTFCDGYLTVSDLPGLGCDIDETAAARYPYERAYLPTTRRADGSVHDW